MKRKKEEKREEKNSREERGHAAAWCFLHEVELLLPSVKSVVSTTVNISVRVEAEKQLRRALNDELE